MASHYVEYPSIWAYLMVLHDWIQAMHVEQEYHSSKLSIAASTGCGDCPRTDDGSFCHLLEVMFTSFFTVQLLLFPL